jgi:hypothetical protein
MNKFLTVILFGLFSLLANASPVVSIYEKNIMKLFNIPKGINIGTDECNAIMLDELKDIGQRGKIIDIILDRSEIYNVYTTITYQGALTFSWRFLDDNYVYINIFVSVKFDKEKNPISVKTARIIGESISRDKITKAPKSLIDIPNEGK